LALLAVMSALLTAPVLLDSAWPGGEPSQLGARGTRRRPRQSAASRVEARAHACCIFCDFISCIWVPA